MQMRRPVRALAGILHVGEATLPRTMASLTSQRRALVNFHIIGHQTKWEAHRQLFERFSADDGDHEVLAKVDADMELIHPELLYCIGVMFRRFRNIDEVLVGVDDWFSGERMIGMSAWRSGTKWTTPPPDLFTDLASNTVRGKLKLIDPGFSLVTHGSEPSESQALRYGAHRALKAAVTRRDARLDRLDTFARFAIERPHEMRLVALAAADRSLHDTPFGRRCIDGDVAPSEEDRESIRRAIRDPNRLLSSVLEQTSSLRIRIDSETSGPDATSTSSTPLIPERPSSGTRRVVRNLLRRGEADAMKRAFVSLLASTNPDENRTSSKPGRPVSPVD